VSLYYNLMADYDAWCEERSRYSETDGTPDGPTASEWERSDDTGINLLHRMAEFLSFESVKEWVYDVGDDNDD
jgi:hypothetical protein